MYSISGFADGIQVQVNSSRHCQWPPHKGTEVKFEDGSKKKTHHIRVVFDRKFAKSKLPYSSQRKQGLYKHNITTMEWWFQNYRPYLQLKRHRDEDGWLFSSRISEKSEPR